MKYFIPLIFALTCSFKALAASLASYPLANPELPDTILITHYVLGNTNNPQTSNLSVTNLGITPVTGTDTNNLYFAWQGNTEINNATNELGNYFGYNTNVTGGRSYTNANPLGYGAYLTISNNGTGQLILFEDQLNNTLAGYVLSSPDLQNWYYASNGACSFTAPVLNFLSAGDMSLVATSSYHVAITGWLSTSSSGGGGVTNGQVLVGPVMQTNSFNSIFLCSSFFGGAVFNYYTSPAWELVQRPMVTVQGVPTFRPLNAGNIAVDFMPNGSPGDSGGYGVVWNDICSIDCLTNNPNPLPCLHLSAHPNFMEVSSVSYNGGTAKPLEFGYGSGNANAIALAICPNVNGWVGINTTNPTATLDITNSSGAGTLHIEGNTTSTLSGVELSGSDNASGLNIWYLNSGWTDAGGLLKQTALIDVGTQATNGVSIVSLNTGTNAQFRLYLGGSGKQNNVLSVNQQGTLAVTNLALQASSVPPLGIPNVTQFWNSNNIGLWVIRNGGTNLLF